MSRKKLSKKEVQRISSIAERLIVLRDYYYDDENDNDVLLQVSGNGTVGDNISCALAALDTILQEY